MRLAIHVLGREVLALNVGQPPALEPTDYAHGEPAAPPELLPFGFHGGAGGTQEHAWQQDVDRPIDTNGGGHQ